MRDRNHEALTQPKSQFLNHVRYNQNICRPFAGEELPDVATFDLLILLGGPQSLLAIEETPYLLDEITLIQTTMAKGIPILGFCLGAQLIGEALGANTEPSPQKEVGIFPLQLTEEGKKDPLLEGLPYTFPAIHWHNDMPGLTADAKILAFSAGCPRQIIRYTPSVYGFQCHFEAKRQNVEEMIYHCPDDLTPGTFVQSRTEFLSHDFEAINALMIQILDQLKGKRFGIRDNDEVGMNLGTKNLLDGV